MPDDTERRIRFWELLDGKKIKDVIAGKDAVRIILEDDSVLSFTVEGGPGAGSDWYQSAVVRLDGREIWRDAT